MTAKTSPRPSSPGFSQQLCALLPDLRRKALQLARSPSAADDLVQDTLERALRYECQFRPGSNLRAWACRIMVNRFISQSRRRSTERRVLETAAFDPNGWAFRESPRQLHRLSPPVDRAVQALPPRLRMAVTVVDLDGGSYRDAAEALNVPVGTIMSRLHRGRARLKERLGADTQASIAA